jgi:hypothetical protein
MLMYFIGWAQEHELQLTHPQGWTTSKEEFDWPEYLGVTKSNAAPPSCFPQRESAKKLGFTEGMKLEAVNPENQHQICAATIIRIIDHLLWIRLESNDRLYLGKEQFVFCTSSKKQVNLNCCLKLKRMRQNAIFHFFRRS